MTIMSVQSWYRGGRRHSFLSGIEITTREILFCVAVGLFWFSLIYMGFGLAEESALEAQRVYSTAIVIENQEDFKYYLETEIGNAFAPVSVGTVDPQSFPELLLTYSQVTRKEEHYTRHTRKVTYTDSNGKTKTRTETYWSWDTYRKETLMASQAEVNGLKLAMDRIEGFPVLNLTLTPETLDKEHYQKTERVFGNDDRHWYKSKSKRVSYTYSPLSLEGCAFLSLTNKTISSPKIQVRHDFTPSSLQTYMLENSEPPGTLHWVLVTIIYLIFVIAFVAAENRWLHRSK